MTLLQYDLTSAELLLVSRNDLLLIVCTTILAYTVRNH
jgi:hypothetical protein